MNGWLTMKQERINRQLRLRILITTEPAVYEEAYESGAILWG